MEADFTWPTRWRGRWIWDHRPNEAQSNPRPVHTTYLRTVVEVLDRPGTVPLRVTCDSRYVLFINGVVVARGPVREDPGRLGWDAIDIAEHLVPGRNTVLALCRYYGAAGPWWLPSSTAGTLGSGSFCLETHPDTPIDIHTGPHWYGRPAPWRAGPTQSRFGLPPEIVDGRALPLDLHDPDADSSGWTAAVPLAATHGSLPRDRPPAAPYARTAQRDIPQLAGPVRSLRRSGGRLGGAEPDDDPAATWNRPAIDATPTDSSRRITTFDAGAMTYGYVRLRATGSDGLRGEYVDLGGGEYLRADGLPESRPRHWAARYILAGHGAEQITFFDPIGIRYIAVHHPASLDVDVTISEAVYPRPEGASFECDNSAQTRLWRVGLRTVELCAADTFIDCPGREQRAWVGDSYVDSLVWLVTSPDPRLVRHALQLAAHSQRTDGLLPMAAGCDLARSEITIPDFSLQWMRTLAAYWRYTGDEACIAELLPAARAIIERYECFRGESGLLEDVPGWVFIDWAQLGRGSVIGAHDALYALALRDFATLPDADNVDSLLAATTRGFEQLWDRDRRVYVDSPGSAWVSQHTNAAAIAAGIVAHERRDEVLSWIWDAPDHGGRVVTTMGKPDAAHQTQRPTGLDAETDVIACEPMFASVLHEAMAACGRVDQILASHRRWWRYLPTGTLPEFWSRQPAAVSTCHGWSAIPTYDLTTYVLGVTPTEPGYARAKIEPHLPGLAAASGRIPTPHGWITVVADQRKITIDIPPGIIAEVGGIDRSAGRHTIIGPTRPPDSVSGTECSIGKDQGGARV